MTEYSITGYKTFTAAYGDEGPGFSATLRRDGKRVGEIVYEGTGGPFTYFGLSDEVAADLKARGRAAYNEWVREQGREDEISEDDPDWGIADVFVGDLIEIVEREREEKREVARRRRAAQKHVLFVLETESPYEGWRYLKNMAGDRERALEWLEKKYGDMVRVYDPADEQWKRIAL